jgi:ABC-type phosphate transport system permease subunit
LRNPNRTVSLRCKLTNGLAVGLITLAALVVTVPLFLILGTVILRGIGELNWAFLTQIPKPVGETGGGMANAIAGSVMLLGLASLIGVPLGVGAGVFLAEYGRNKLGNIVRFTCDVLNGVPSIVIGLTAYALVVVVQKHFPMLAGSIALGIMMSQQFPGQQKRFCYWSRSRSVKPLWVWAFRAGAPTCQWFFGRPVQESLSASCWPLPGLPEKLHR